MVQSLSWWCVPCSSTLLSPGARCSSPSLSWISKSIRWLSLGGFHSRRPRQCETTPWAEEKNTAAQPLMCFTSRTAVVPRFQHTHTHAQACCPPPMTTSWPHSSHLLLRPWLTCPPNRKIGRPFTNAPWSLSGPNVTWTDTYLNCLTCLCTRAAGGNCCVSNKAEKVAPLHASARLLWDWAVGPLGVLGLNENQLAKFYPVPRTNRHWMDSLDTPKHLEHLCCLRFNIFPFIFGLSNEFCLPELSTAFKTQMGIFLLHRKVQKKINK